jgi:23S rRNA pseudouridine1911/1915/1917 synthase
MRKVVVRKAPERTLRTAFFSNFPDMEIIYEDNHLIAVNKNCHEIVQGDKTGDIPLPEMLKEWLKEKYAKPGNVFAGVIHRLDRPVTGAVVFAKTSKALQRMNEKFRLGEVKKNYWAIVKNNPPEPEGELIHWLVRNEKQNKSFAYDAEKPGAKQAILHYRLIAQSERYFLLEIDLKTGRHHQIRCQLAKIGCPVKGDLKYGADRSNPDGGISLHARSISFLHPVTRQPVRLVAPVPGDTLWQALAESVPVHPDETLSPEKP